MCARGRLVWRTCLQASLLVLCAPFQAMGDPPPNPEAPSQQPSSRRTSQASEPRRSWEPSQPQAVFSDEVQQALLNQQRGSRSSQPSQDIRASQTSLRWLQGDNLPEDENLPLYQAPSGLIGGPEYQPMSAGFPSQFQTQTYQDENGIPAVGEQTTSLMQQLQQLQQSQGGFFQQLESPVYQDPGANVLGQYTMYQRDDPQFMQTTEHGPYLRDDPALHFSPSELGFMNFGMEMPEPEPRELAVQNAKAYLLQTSISCDLSL